MSQQEGAQRGAVELWPVDIRCIYKRLSFSKHFTRSLLRPYQKRRSAAVQTCGFEDEHTLEAGKKIIMMAIENYKTAILKRYLFPAAQSLILLLVLVTRDY